MNTNKVSNTSKRKLRDFKSNILKEDEYLEYLLALSNEESDQSESTDNDESDYENELITERKKREERRKANLFSSDESNDTDSSNSGNSDNEFTVNDSNIQLQPINQNNDIVNVPIYDQPNFITDANDQCELLSDDNEDPEEEINWSDDLFSFAPRFLIPNYTLPSLNVPLLNDKSTEFAIFRKFFPKSLVQQITFYTNQRIAIENELQVNKKYPKKISYTDYGEITTVLGIMLIMSYNRVPSLHDYWSNNLSLGNTAIKNVIGRDRFCFLFSKLYFNNPKKPADAETRKTYYLEEVVSCLKKTFMENRSDSSFQSIDESMVKFKGRSSLKQYMPMKPIKRGIKIWMRSDSKTGYVYDFNIYQGKDLTSTDEGTLGEKVVRKLLSTIKRNPSETMIACDCFFTSVHMMNSFPFPLVGTFMKNRKNTPQFSMEKLERGSIRFLGNQKGTLAALWKDCKDVVALSNCHEADVTIVKRKSKTGKKLEYYCPTSIATYNLAMGGVDLFDQNISLYDIDRRSNKWWKRTFMKLLMAAVVNSWIYFKELHKCPKLSLKTFLVSLAELLCIEGCEQTEQRKRTVGRPSQLQRKLGNHDMKKISKRRRCSLCNRNKKVEKRVSTICSQCNVALCPECFGEYHRKK